MTESANMKLLIRISNQGANAAARGHPARTGNAGFRTTMRAHPARKSKR